MTTTTVDTNRAIAEDLDPAARALAEAIRALGSIPSGHLYAALMTIGMTLDTYNRFLSTLIGAGLVRRDPSHLLTWIGPVEQNPDRS